MIIFSCDKKGCNFQVSFTSFWRMPYGEGAPTGLIEIPLKENEITQLRSSLPGSQQVSSTPDYKTSMAMLCKAHTEELSRIRNEIYSQVARSTEDFIKSDTQSSQHKEGE